MNPNQSDDLNTGSDRDIENQSSFTPKSSSNPNNRTKRNLSHDSDMVNQMLFTPKRPSSSTSRMNRNQSEYWDTGSDKDMENQSPFT